ncbi:DUF7019 family protein [Streptomyces sp. NPDC058220]|uniref:DUF7019 family protein n=1 Tax=unclassified Streptomyces TaxID=2593676 RepID=UPI003668FC68
MGAQAGHGAEPRADRGGCEVGTETYAGHFFRPRSNVPPAFVHRITKCHPAADRVARLERVLRHLEDHADLGHVDEPGQYVHGVRHLRQR